MNGVTLKVLYSCKICGAADREVEVPERDEKGDVLDWMQKIVIEAVGKDHLQFRCPSPHVDLKIPLPPNARFIGEAIRQ